MQKLIKILQAIADSKFYGELCIKFENGKPVGTVKKTESVKL